VEQTAARLRELALFARSLGNVAFDPWHRPIRPGKWSVHEILGHIWLWDTYNLEFMIPFIKEDAELRFANHASINGNAEWFARTIGKADMIRNVTKTREELVQACLAAYDKETRFYVGEKRLGMDDFLQKYIIDHDRHHRKQIEAYIGGRQSI
jgi:uncharacterized damage-inducible protein DinB